MSVAGKILPPNGFLGRKGVVSLESMEAFSVIAKEKLGVKKYVGITAVSLLARLSRATVNPKKIFENFFFECLFIKNECTQHCVVECRVRFMYETPTDMYNMTRLHKVSERFTRLEIKVGPYFLETRLVLLDEKK